MMSQRAGTLSYLTFAAGFSRNDIWWKMNGSILGQVTLEAKYFD